MITEASRIEKAFTITRAEQATLKRAFDLVCPTLVAKALAKRGGITPARAALATWRDAIAARVSQKQLDAASVTIEQVVEAVAFYTATEATVREALGGGFIVQADGYRAGATPGTLVARHA